MSDNASNSEAHDAVAKPGEYVVIARRYRPQGFSELIGQEHVSQALSNAIAGGRVGHAYLFTGARGVGKTSSARILAKALNCVEGPTATPCGVCDICRSIASGEDVDVLEIDGASNRGIDEIRSLRQNANIRPSRARFKIYIIDEVHMLTREAFNALLKTLEEPPEHVKFIFCTTEAGKIPITILSRCQRFDFAGIESGSIAARLKMIVEAEGVEADAEALQLLARRAAGSMRDSQSLLEQLLAFSHGQITVSDVHKMLGTAGEERLGTIATALADHNAAQALADLDEAVREGVDAAQLLEQLFGYFRDCMVAASGCKSDVALYAAPGAWGKAAELGKRLGMATLLAAMQILDQTLARMRISTQGRILAELAMVRICRLEELDDLASLVAEIRGMEPGGGDDAQSGAPPRTVAPSPGLKKNFEPTLRSAATRPERASSDAALDENAPPETDEGPPSEDDGREGVALTAANVCQVWNAALGQMSGVMADQARVCDRVELAGPNRIAVIFEPDLAIAKSTCERPDQLQKFETALRNVVGGSVRVEFRLDQSAGSRPTAAAQPVRVPAQHTRLIEARKNPMIVRANELFGAEPVKVDEPARQE